MGGGGGGVLVRAVNKNPNRYGASLTKSGTKAVLDRIGARKVTKSQQKSDFAVVQSRNR